MAAGKMAMGEGGVISSCEGEGEGVVGGGDDMVTVGIEGVGGIPGVCARVNDLRLNELVVPVIVALRLRLPVVKL